MIRNNRKEVKSYDKTGNKKKKLNGIINYYCVVFDSLCKSDRNNASIYYDYINRISGIFDLLSYESALSLDEHSKFHNEVLDKLEIIYNKYK